MSETPNYKTLEKQVKYLSQIVAIKIQDVARRKLASGGLDPEQFDLSGESDWKLAKVLVSAALEDPDITRSYYPEHDAALKKIIDNLKHF